MDRKRFVLTQEAAETLRLASAVLVYKGNGGAAFATVHEVQESESGPPMLLPGKAMTVLAAARLARSFTKRGNKGGFVPPNLLFQDALATAWWVPPGRRHVWFRCAEFGEGDVGASVPHPGLVFAVTADRSWLVWAVKGSERPAEDTPMFTAPYFNVYAGGAICRGNVEVPAVTDAERIEAWNTAFFGSFFTHPNNPRTVICEGGAHRFWKDMLAGAYAQFPDDVLVPLDKTLAQLLARRALT